MPSAGVIYREQSHPRHTQRERQSWIHRGKTADWNETLGDVRSAQEMAQTAQENVLSDG